MACLPAGRQAYGRRLDADEIAAIRAEVDRIRDGRETEMARRREACLNARLNVGRLEQKLEQARADLERFRGDG